MAKKVSTVVRAVGISANTAMRGNKDLANAIQAAMENAVHQAHAEGVTDDEQVRARMMAAREAVKSNWAR